MMSSPVNRLQRGGIPANNHKVPLSLLFTSLLLGIVLAAEASNLGEPKVLPLGLSLLQNTIYRDPPSLFLHHQLPTSSLTQNSSTCIEDSDERPQGIMAYRNLLHTLYDAAANQSPNQVVRWLCESGEVIQDSQACTNTQNFLQSGGPDGGPVIPPFTSSLEQWGAVLHVRVEPHSPVLSQVRSQCQQSQFDPKQCGRLVRQATILRLCSLLQSPHMHLSPSLSTTTAALCEPHLTTTTTPSTTDPLTLEVWPLDGTRLYGDKLPLFVGVTVSPELWASPASLQAYANSCFIHASLDGGNEAVFPVKDYLNDHDYQQEEMTTGGNRPLTTAPVRSIHMWELYSLVPSPVSHYTLDCMPGRDLCLHPHDTQAHRLEVRVECQLSTDPSVPPALLAHEQSIIHVTRLPATRIPSPRTFRVFSPDTPAVQYQATFSNTPTWESSSELAHHVCVNSSRDLLGPNRALDPQQSTQCMEFIERIVDEQLVEAFHQHSYQIFLEQTSIVGEVDFTVEGHTGFCHHKQAWLRWLARLTKPKTVCEIGFNSGHSALNILLATPPETKVISFDLGYHNYTAPAAVYLQTAFPGRLELIIGDSTKTIPTFRAIHQGFKCDMIFVDGGHDYEVALADLENMAMFAHEDTWVAVDDSTFFLVDKAIQAAKDKGVLDPSTLRTSYDYCREVTWMSSGNYWNRFSQPHYSGLTWGRYSFPQSAAKE